jgi:hypothetical protein
MDNPSRNGLDALPRFLQSVCGNLKEHVAETERLTSMGVFMAQLL